MDFWPVDLGDNTFVLFSVVQVMVFYYSSS